MTKKEEKVETLKENDMTILEMTEERRKSKLLWSNKLKGEN